MQSILDFLSSHKAMLSIAAGWCVREAHLWWPKIEALWPYVQNNGGVIGIWKQFWHGKQPTP